MGNRLTRSMGVSAEQHRVVLTGAAGMLGQAVLAELAAMPDMNALALLRRQHRLPVSGSGVRYEIADLFDTPSIHRLLQAFRPTVFVHAAATGMQTPRPGWEELVRTNVELGVRLCELVAQHAGCRFVFVSTGLVYADQCRALREEDPLDARHPYAAAKAAAETLLRAASLEWGVPLTIVRPFSFSGPGDTGTRLFPLLLRAAAEGQRLALSPGDQRRDHCAVADIARGVVLAALRKDSSAGPEVFNLGRGDTATLRQLVERVVAELGLDVRLDFGARDYSPFEPKYLVADAARARTQLGWQAETNFAHALWQLARESFPSLKLKEPVKCL